MRESLFNMLSIVYIYNIVITHCTCTHVEGAGGAEKNKGGILPSTNLNCSYYLLFDNLSIWSFLNVFFYHLPIWSLLSFFNLTIYSSEVFYISFFWQSTHLTFSKFLFLPFTHLKFTQFLCFDHLPIWSFLKFFFGPFIHLKFSQISYLYHLPIRHLDKNSFWQSIHWKHLGIRQLHSIKNIAINNNETAVQLCTKCALFIIAINTTHISIKIANICGIIKLGLHRWKYIHQTKHFGSSTLKPVPTAQGSSHVYLYLTCVQRHLWLNVNFIIKNDNTIKCDLYYFHILPQYVNVVLFQLSMFPFHSVTLWKFLNSNYTFCYLTVNLYQNYKSIQSYFWRDHNIYICMCIYILL